MAKAKRMYGCTECGATFPKWAGQCAECGTWNTLTETLIEAHSAALTTLGARVSVQESGLSAISTSTSALGARVSGVERDVAGAAGDQPDQVELFVFGRGGPFRV